MIEVIPTLFPDGADPWVVRHTDGFLYYISSRGGNVLEIRRACTLIELPDAEPVTVWTPPGGTPYSHELWAPELHFVRGQWWIYVAADDGDNHNHRMYALSNPSPNPQEGTWTLHPTPLATEKWAIDGTVFETSNQLYFVWSGWEGDENVAQNLYIAPMSDPATLSGPRVLLSVPEYEWEKRGCGNGLPTINEGPQVLIKGDAIHIIYSASGSWSDFYCLGRLSLTKGGDLLDPTAWHKHPEAVFEGTSDAIAPGHCSFLTNPTDGDWIIYHTAKHAGAGWNRMVRAQRFVWNGDIPQFGVPLLMGVAP
jgi:GH43 family beta-xylosidase